MTFKYVEHGSPHDFQVVPRQCGPGFFIVDREGEPIEPMEFFPTKDDADDAIGSMIGDDDEDRHAHRGRHENGV